VDNGEAATAYGDLRRRATASAGSLRGPAALGLGLGLDAQGIGVGCLYNPDAEACGGRKGRRHEARKVRASDSVRVRIAHGAGEGREGKEGAGAERKSGGGA